MDVTPARTTGLPDARDLTPAARRALAGVWAYRAGAERQAAVRFERLGSELVQTGALPEVVALAERAVDDERRHVELCRAMADAYGGAAEPEAAQSAEAIGPEGLSHQDRVLYEVVAFCCITEALNTSLMKVCLDRARVSEVRSVLREILADEVLHARLGWAHLAAARARGRGEFLASALPRMLEGAVRDELFSPGARHPDADALECHGELEESLRLAIFRQTAQHVLLAGFELHGIDVRPMRAWLCQRS